MTAQDNMEELQRWSMEIVVRPGAYSYGNESVGYEHDPDGEWVRFSDVQEREARFQARIEELTAQDEAGTTPSPVSVDRDRDELIEAVAKELYMHGWTDMGGFPAVRWPDIDKHEREAYRASARAALSAIERADQ